MPHIRLESSPEIKMVKPEPCKELRRRPQLLLPGFDCGSLSVRTQVMCLGSPSSIPVSYGEVREFSKSRPVRTPPIAVPKAPGLADEGGVPCAEEVVHLTEKFPSTTRPEHPRLQLSRLVMLKTTGQT